MIPDMSHDINSVTFGDSDVHVRLFSFICLCHCTNSFLKYLHLVNIVNSVDNVFTLCASFCVSVCAQQHDVIILMMS